MPARNQNLNRKSDLHCIDINADNWNKTRRGKLLVLVTSRERTGPAVRKQFNKMAVLYFLRLNSTLYF